MTSRTRKRSRRAGSGSSSSLTLGLAVGAVRLFAAGFAVFGGGDDEVASGFDLDAIAAPVVDGAPATGTGQVAPSVTGASLLGDGEVGLPVAGEGTMIVFLAHWCSYCNAELPVIEEWLAAGPLPDGVAVRTVATGIDPTRPNYPPDTWLGERGWTIPSVVDTDGSIGEAYGIGSYPAWVFVDAGGTIVARSGGTDAATLAQVATALASG